MGLEQYAQVFELIVTAGAISLPIVVTCALIERAYNALFGMIAGKQVVKF